MPNQWDSQWTQDQIDVAMRLPAREAAEVLGRTPTAVYLIRHKVRNGYVPQPPSNGRSRHLSVAWSRGGRTLLAQTCTKCGWLIDARYFGKQTYTRKGRTYTRWRYWCSWCMTEKTSQDRRERRARGLRDRRSSDVDIPTPRSGYTWTEFDHQVAADPNLTVIEKALKTGRSYRAITQACAKNHYPSLPLPWIGEKKETWQIVGESRTGEAG